MVVSRLLLVIVGACLFSRCSCVIWGPKEKTEEHTPQLFEISGGKQLQSELQEIAKHVTGRGIYSNKFQKRQAEEEDEEDISTAFTLTNDTHFYATVHWTGYPSENIFILTRDSVSNARESWLWRSTDYGKTFINETYKLNNSTIQLYYIGPSRSILWFADVINNRLQITEDVGETFTSVDVPFRPDRLRFQSRSAPESDAYSRYLIGYDAQAETLWVSSDLGYNWKKIGDNVPFNRYYWRRLDADIEGDLSTVYFEQRTSNTSDFSRLYYATFPYDEVQLFSADLGVFQSRSFLLLFDYMFVQKPDSNSSSSHVHSSPLWVSYRRATHFTQAMFPLVSEELQHLHYSVVDASEGIVFIAVYHNVNITNLYVSDATGTSYVLSLPYITSPSRQDWASLFPAFDVHVVNGIDGTVFANQRVPGRDFGTTLVSHNKGGQWAPLRPPAVDSVGTPIVCAPPECSLHLRMETDIPNGYQSILSQNTAVGLIMAVGNFGRNLSRSRSSRFTEVYLSRDGGFTWEQVEKGIWEFQFLALGSIIVMVRKFALIDSVKWSCDEGATWTTSVIDEPTEGGRRMTVIGMKTEFGEKPRFVTIFGIDYLKYINNNFEVEWIVYTLNFTSVVNQLCDATDYYDWIPTDERQDGNCLLGEVITYERRNSTACCYVDPEYQKPVNNSVCPCTLEDYECDFGFERSSLTAPCTPVFGFTYPPPPPPNCPEGTNYTYSQGYRKIPGDECVENENLDLSFLQPITVSCPVQIATGLSISYDPLFIQPNDLVSFILTQNSGSRVSTVYRWSFNDSTPDVEVTGLGMAVLQEHTFTAPGVYIVRVSASNEAGTSETTRAVTVLDSLVGFSVQFPSAILNDSVPIEFFLEFSATVTTKFNTRFLSNNSPFEILWDFGDGRRVSSSEATIGHIYRVTGTFTMSAAVRAQFSSVNTVQTWTVRTYEAARTVDISTDGLMSKDGRFFTQVQQPVQFSATPTLNSTEIPPQSTYSWQIQQPRGVSDATSEMKTITFNFPTWGQYRVSVSGAYLTTGSFIGMIEVNAQSAVEEVIVDVRGTARSGSLITMLVSPRTSDGSAFTGPISMFLDSSSGDRLLAHSSTARRDMGIELIFSLKQKGSLDAQLTVSNDISVVTQDLKFVIVDPGEYGVLSVVFDTERLPANYNDQEWQEKLSSTLVQFMSTKYSRDESLIEVEGIATIAQTGRSRRMVKRDAGTFLVVDVNILPEDYTADDIQAAIEVVDRIIADVDDKIFTFTVDGVVVRADYAYDPSSGDPIQIVNPTAAPSSNVVIDIVLGVVFAVFILVFVVVLVIVIYFCHRRYKQLNTKYTHLEETAGGNLTFNEAFGEQGSTEKESLEKE